MRKTFGTMMSETWGLFSDNFVLLVPPFIIGILNLAVYGFLAAVLFVVCIKDFIAMGLDFRNPANIDPNIVISYFAQFVFYIFGIIMIGMTYSFVMKTLHGAGWCRMHAKVVTEGKTGLGDYLEGIGLFAGRMLWFVMLRSSFYSLIPLMALTAAVAVISGAGATEESFMGGALVFFGGLGVAGLFNIVLFFVMWMWRPAMFIRDLPVMQALRESMRFAGRYLGSLILYLFVYFAVLIAVTSFFGVFNLFFRLSMQGSDSELLKPAAVLLAIAGILRWIVMLAIRIFFSLFYYQFYSDNYAAEPSAFSTQGGGENPFPYAPVEPVPYSETAASPGQVVGPPEDPFKPQRPKTPPPGTPDINSPGDDSSPPPEPLPPGFC